MDNERQLGQVPANSPDYFKYILVNIRVKPMNNERGFRNFIKIFEYAYF